MRPSRFFVVMFVSLTALTFAGPSSSGQTVTDIYSFTGQGSSQDPSFVTPAQGRDGALYGTTQGFGGYPDYGSVFRLTTTGLGGQLFAFDYTRGGNPSASLMLATDGSLYGVAAGGGSSADGVLFRITPSGVYSVLHNFAGGTNGSVPRSALVEASDGNLYGTTEGTGSLGNGSTIYRYTPTGVFSTIYQFDQNTAIIDPLIQGSDGNLYGTAYNS